MRWSLYENLARYLVVIIENYRKYPHKKAEQKVFAGDTGTKEEETAREEGPGSPSLLAEWYSQVSSISLLNEESNILVESPTQFQIPSHIESTPGFQSTLHLW